MVLNPASQDGDKGGGKDEKEQLTEKAKSDLLGNLATQLGRLDTQKRKVDRLKTLLIENGLGETWTLSSDGAKGLYEKLKLDPEHQEEMNEWLRDQVENARKRRAIAAGLVGDRRATEAALVRQLPLLQFRPDYTRKLHLGWFAVGEKCDVPKGACYVRHCGKTWVWVIPGHEAALADFALVILDITTYQPPYRAHQGQVAPATGRAATR